MTEPLRCSGFGCPPDYKFACVPYHAEAHRFDDRRHPKRVGEHCSDFKLWEPPGDLAERTGALK